METKNLTIGERIRYRRKTSNTPKGLFAKAPENLPCVCITMGTWGDSEPTGKNLFALSKVLQCSPTWILFGDEDKQPTLPVEKPAAFILKELELLELFNALPESEQDTQLRRNASSE
ncbi:transcriptional regulator [Escherichia coli]|nr:transcriptional regulator [Escherichia coli]